MTVVDEMRKRNDLYWASDVYHYVADNWKGCERLQLDHRPVAGREAFFFNYDMVKGKNGNNPNESLYMHMNDYKSVREFTEHNRKDRTQKIEEMNRRYPGSNNLISYASKKKKKKKKKDKKRVDLDVRPYPSPIFTNYDYTDAGPNETSPGGGLYHGSMGKYKSTREFIDKSRKARRKARAKALAQLFGGMDVQKTG